MIQTEQQRAGVGRALRKGGGAGMFGLTMNKAGLRKAAVAVGCAALIFVAAFTVKGAVGKNTTAAAITGDASVNRSIKVKNTDDMVTFLLSFGVEADLASAKVDKVKVPKIWDDSFVAFNEVIRRSRSRSIDWARQTPTFPRFSP